MSKYVKLGFGKLYPNTKKDGEKSPDIGGPVTMGTADADGNIVGDNIWNQGRISLWKQDDGSFTLQFTKDTQAVAAAPIAASSDEVDDAIPF